LQCGRRRGALRNAGILFLNNDTESHSAGWLDRLIVWTSLPSIGAVGAKLLYPDGRLQHAGVVIGVDGHATHFERFRPPDEPGFFERINVPHEVSAVTGACLAVEKAKFDAVGGFDEVNLPVEFSDIDLCLRLRERGWTALIEPAAVFSPSRSGNAESVALAGAALF
jgi:O-antigen biosynthesis protein